MKSVKCTMKSLFTTLGIATALTVSALTATSAQAGGIVIYGRAQSTDELSAEAPTAALPSVDPAQLPLTPEEQQIYLFATLVFSGHDAEAARMAAQMTGAEAAVVLPGEEASGGCAASSPSGLAALSALALVARLAARRKR